MEIRLEDVGYTIDGQEIIRNLSFSLKSGQKAVIAWPSGTGKTTLLKLIFGFTIPTTGKIFIDNQLLNHSNVKHFRKQMSYANQVADLPKGTVQNSMDEILSFPANAHIKDYKSTINNLLSEVRLSSEIFGKNTEELSGGERQRLTFILCQVLNRPIWLLDEITSGLDTDNKSNIVRMVAEASQTVLISSHDTIWRENNAFTFINL
ncbi:MAG: ATP-binding cassette domain-containing protein [Salinivirgaceae bacterium]|nr:ATP-binding cassette domain-containing protein [Salinivirgaceae bacterium]